MRTMVYDTNEIIKLICQILNLLNLFDSYIDNVIKLIINNKNITYIKYEILLTIIIFYTIHQLI